MYYRGRQNINAGVLMIQAASEFCAAIRMLSMGQTSHRLQVIESTLQVAHSLFRRLAQSLNKERKINPMSACRFDAASWWRVEQLFFKVIHVEIYFICSEGFVLEAQ